jgi:hypothetical protein
MIGTGYKSIGERAQALLRHPYADLHDAGILLHPTLHRRSRKPLLLLGGGSMQTRGVHYAAAAVVPWSLAGRKPR